VAASPPQSIPEIVNDLKELLVTYTKQQTIDPLRPVGAALKRAIPGGLMVGFGGCFLALGVLRGLQLLERMQGFWSFAPYVLVGLFLCAWSGILVLKIKKRAPVAAGVEIVSPRSSTDADVHPSPSGARP